MDSTRIETAVTGTAVTLKFPDHPEITVDLSKIAPEVREYAGIYGMMVRLTRATAVSRAGEGGRIKSAVEMQAEKYTAAKALADHYNSGSPNWELRASRERPDGLLAQAIAEWSGKAIDGIISKLNEMSRAERTRLMTHPEIAPIYSRLLAQSGDSSADELLASI